MRSNWTVPKRDLVYTLKSAMLCHAVQICKLKRSNFLSLSFHLYFSLFVFSLSRFGVVFFSPFHPQKLPLKHRCIGKYLPWATKKHTHNKILPVSSQCVCVSNVNYFRWYLKLAIDLNDFQLQVHCDSNKTYDKKKQTQRDTLKNTYTKKTKRKQQQTLENTKRLKEFPWLPHADGLISFIYSFLPFVWHAIKSIV